MNRSLLTILALLCGLAASPAVAQSYVVGGSGGESGDTLANGQTHKDSFFGQKVDSDIYSHEEEQRPKSPNIIQAGTVVMAALLTGLDSDLPGQIIAQVKENVFDTPVGNLLLIPQGSRLVGRYDSHVTYGQTRALVVWSRLIRPDGTSIVLENLPGTDAAGFAGVEDEVDNHWGKVIGGALLSTLFDTGVEYVKNQTTDEKSLAGAIADSGSSNAQKIGQMITQKNLNIQPTIRVRPGFPVAIIVNKDIVLSPYKG